MDDDDFERLESRIDLLLKLQTVDIEGRLFEHVLASLTPAEKKALKEKVLANLEAQLDRQVERQMPQIAKEYLDSVIRQNAFDILKARWGAFWHPKLAEQVEGWILQACDPERLGPWLEQNVIQMRRTAVEKIVNEAVAKVRKAMG